MRYRLFFLFCFLFSKSAFSFDPIHIDDFFSNYPNEKEKSNAFFQDSEIDIKQKSDISTQDIQPVPSEKKEIHKHKIVSRERESVVKIKEFNKISFLLINRISGKSETVETKVGDPLFFANFKIIPSSCQRRVMSNNATYTPVNFRVLEQDREEESEESLLYSNHIYIEVPGINGFEHPIYDIRPVACTS